MKEIPLTKGMVALVSDEDYEWLSQYKWRARRYTGSQDYYAYRIERLVVDGVRRMKCYAMHREILGLKHGDGLHGDHKNHNTLDNRRFVDGEPQLRIATHAQNRGNTRKLKPKSSKYKGVHWSKKYEKWVASITIDGKQKFLGSFDEEWQAALRYNEAAIETFAEFALLNIVPEGTYELDRAA